ncbi:MAG: 1-(5-phosphoribosyl)-5-((5-phosphoribosylamino)methylideneamino)imidazole-4-carboxamide isomerase, partial [Candidatus Margulisbacteria bacterium]|nr:1-(5-phosphoribosyl)-5-((5-phosphoribosylamino)methylideneamino)imidazole-4-carboxamide isomerase [Candidatus Margulisiibacteriota bacterium]
MFEVIPAVDILDGKCVRLVQGRFDMQTVFNKDPIAAAQKWEE